MGYIAYVMAAIAMLFTNTSGMTFDAGFDIFLDKAAGINQFIFFALLVVCGILGVLSVAFRFLGKEPVFSFGCGCGSLIFLIFPVVHFVIWQLNLGLASNWGPEGATDPVRFGLFALITLFIGTG